MTIKLLTSKVHLPLLTAALLMFPTIEASGQAISANSGHMVVAKPDGSVWTWGVNWSGQLGDGTTTRRDLPTQVPGLTNVVGVAAGDNHSLAVKTDGTVWSWGSNGNGRLGNGNTTQQLSPVQVSGLSGVIAVTAGAYHSVALKADGTVWAWGSNSSGYVGDGTTTDRHTPVQVTSLTGAVAISSRSGHTLALKSDGTVVAWGANGNAQLGDGTTTMRASPVAVTGLTAVTAISAGESHSLALKTDGTVKAWGWNGQGRLGDGSTTQRATPVSVANIGSISSISAGGTLSAASGSDGSTWTWGDNQFGQLGDGSTTGALTPIAVPALSTTNRVMTGQSFTVFLTDDDTLWATGRNNTAQLGDGTLVNRLSPVKVSEANLVWKVGTPTFSVPSGTYTAIQNVFVGSATVGATIHYTTNGAEPTELDPTVPGNGIVTVSQPLTVRARAWKSGTPESNVDASTYGFRVATPTLSPSTGTYSQPQAVTVSTTVAGAALHFTTDGTDPTQASSSIASGGTINISVTTTLKVRAWYTGWTVSDQAQATHTLKVATPTISPGAGLYSSTQTVTISTSSPGVTLRYTTNGSEPSSTDASVVSGGSVSISSACTLRVKGFRAGWSDSDPTLTTFSFNYGDVAAPVFTPAAGTYTAGQSVALATVTGGATIRYTLDNTEPTLWSAVYNAALRIDKPVTIKARAFKADWTPSGTTIGTYDFDYGTVALPVLLPPGGDYSVATTVTLSTTTVGATIHYTTNGLEPTDTDPAVASGAAITVDKGTRVRAKAFKSGMDPSRTVTGDYWITGAIAAGDAHTLALKADGTVWAWGYNVQGQLGDGSQTQSTSPVQVFGLANVTGIAAGTSHSLAVKRDGTVWAWGANSSAQLGEPNIVQRRLMPVQVAGLTDVVSVAAGESFSLALKRDGTVCGWGANSSGQLGDGSQTMRPAPVCPSLLTGVAAIAAGGLHAMALKTGGETTGSVWTWGANNVGQLGDGSTIIYRTVPVGVLPAAKAVGAGFNHGMAVLPDGTVKSWGANAGGSLGDGTQTLRRTPVFAQDLDGILALSGGRRHSLARGHQLTTWFFGETWSDTYHVPYRHAGAGSSVMAVAAGGSHSVVASRDGSVWAWGDGSYGQLGDATTTTRNLVRPVPGFSLVSADWLTGDQDGDGLPTWRELAEGTDPRNPDTNDDGLRDGVAMHSGASAVDPDMDGDGVANATERQNGTDPFRVDTDSDGASDAVDHYPLDPLRSLAPTPVPGDTTPPTIFLIFPTNAIRILPPA